MNEDCLVVSDPRMTVLEMSVSIFPREKRIEQFRRAADGGDGGEYSEFSPHPTKTTICGISRA